MESIKDREVFYYSVSCKSLDNIDKCLEWIVNHTKSGSANKSKTNSAAAAAAGGGGGAGGSDSKQMTNIPTGSGSGTATGSAAAAPNGSAVPATKPIVVTAAQAQAIPSNAKTAL